MKEFDYSKPKSYLTYKILMPLAKIVVKALYRVKYEGLENVPKGGDGLIIASNHVSFFDPVIIGASGVRTIHCMGKYELFQIPVFRTLLIHLNAFPVKRGSSDKRSVEYAIKVIESGEDVGIFPEGTRSENYRPSQGKAGVALIAAKTGADVLPVTVYSGGKQLKPFRTKVTVRFGEVIKNSDLGIEKGTSSELRGAARKIMQHITELWEAGY